MTAIDDRSRPSISREEAELKNMKSTQSSQKGRGSIRTNGLKLEVAMDDSMGSPRYKSSTQSPAKPSCSPDSSDVSKSEEIVGGEVIVKMEPGQPPKLARSSLHKIPSRPAQLYHDYPSKTEEAKGVFEVIPTCTYSSKYMGATEHGMDCDCSEEWDSSTKTNAACGEDSDCINRATKIECVGDCGCGPRCQNQRFQRRAYSPVTVFQTEKKGYGLRADSDVNAHDFIYEYIGEVVNEVQFRRRTIQYNDEGIKHFYFMSLTKNEFVDATKKGNLGRFCNHSCNPNCYVDKWVVGDKLRMGIFAERKIKAGEELVFNYNVDRYGADPQPCYCGEPNCTGYIGGKTQTERATQLSTITIEALGIDDGDGWDTAVAKKPRKKKAGEDDEEYVNNVQPKSLDEDGVTKVMATLMQGKEKWIAVKVLGRIQRCEDEKVRNRVVKMHGYQILNSNLTLWKDDFNVVLQILDILEKFPRLTRNKISDSKIESTVESLVNCGDGRVETRAAALLQEWSELEVAYRIPRKKRETNDTATPERPDRYSRRESGPKERRGRSRSRSKSRTRSRSKSMDAPRGPAAPSGPRGGFQLRNPTFYGVPRPPPRPRAFPPPLPAGWHSAMSNGTPYYYTATGETTWTKPTTPAAPPPPPPKPTSANPTLDAIIKEIEESKAIERKEKVSASATPQPTAGLSTTEKKVGNEKWRSYSEEKQKKLYENTLYPPIKYVVDKFRHKLPKDELKKFAKQVAKKLVDSDFKHHRVEDPTKISPKQEQHVKRYVKDYFEKVVAQRKAHEKKKVERQAQKDSKESRGSTVVTPPETSRLDEHFGADDCMDMSDDEGTEIKPGLASPNSPVAQMIDIDGLKRKRHDGDDADGAQQDEQATPTKRHKSETPPPPPPPPPPAQPAQQGLEDDNQSGSEPSPNSQLHDQGVLDLLGTATFGDSLPNRTTTGDSLMVGNSESNEDHLGGKMVESIEYSPAVGSREQSEDRDPMSLGFDLMNEGHQERRLDLGHLARAPKVQVGHGR